MNNKQAAEQAFSFYKEQEDTVQVELKEINDETLKELLTTCDSTKHMEILYHWFLDEENPTESNWTDVEGEGYGWLWLNHPEKEWHGRLRNRLVEYIQEKKDKQSDVPSYMIFVEDKTKKVYNIYERDTEQRDIVFSFSDEELDY